MQMYMHKGKDYRNEYSLRTTIIRLLRAACRSPNDHLHEKHDVQTVYVKYV